MSRIGMSSFQFRTSVNEPVGFTRRAGISVFTDILTFYFKHFAEHGFKIKVKSAVGLCMCGGLCAAWDHLSTAVLNLTNRNCVFSLVHTHTLRHWCSLFALKAAVGCDPCHVNVASSAPLWKAKVMLGIVGSRWNRFRVGSSVIPTVTLDPK